MISDVKHIEKRTLPPKSLYKKEFIQKKKDQNQLGLEILRQINCLEKQPIFPVSIKHFTDHPGAQNQTITQYPNITLYNTVHLCRTTVITMKSNRCIRFVLVPSTLSRQIIRG